MGLDRVFKKVRKNKYGFYELIKKPDGKAQRDNFEEKYYQECLSGSYEPDYTGEEIQFRENKILQKEMSWKHIFGEQKIRILDIGCGEGYFLKHFWEKGQEVQGIDYSLYALQKNNPELLPYFIQGDAYEGLKEMADAGKVFDIVNMDSVLDMMQDPDGLLELVKGVLARDGVFCCKVANNYSYFQIKLLEENKLQKEYWLDPEGHISYFNKDGMLSFFRAHGYECKDIYAEGLAEFFLLNSYSNYYEKPETGKECHKAAVYLENMMHGISSERTHEVMRQIGHMGLGRELVGLFSLQA